MYDKAWILYLCSFWLAELRGLGIDEDLGERKNRKNTAL
jgi:hypothetical protein